MTISLNFVSWNANLYNAMIIKEYKFCDINLSLYYRMIHGTLCCWLRETQYSSFCKAAKIGSEGEKTFDTGELHSFACVHNMWLSVGMKTYFFPVDQVLHILFPCLLWDLKGTFLQYLLNRLIQLCCVLIKLPHFITVLKKFNYMAVVKRVCGQEMRAAQEEVKNSCDILSMAR